MQIKELIIRGRRELDILFCLTGVIPFLVFFYLLVNKLAGFGVFVGQFGYIMFISILVFLTGMALGRQMLKNMQKELIERNRLAAITETTLALSHEINNPLLTIRGNLELLERDLIGSQLPPEAENRLHIIKSHCERIREVTDKLSGISKPALEAIYGAKKMLNLTNSQ